MTFKLTRLPKDYPTGFKFPPGMEPNLADYEDRYDALQAPTYSTLPLLTHKMRSRTGAGAFASRRSAT